MSGDCKQLFLNPVLAAPWKAHNQAEVSNYKSSPPLLTCKVKKRTAPQALSKLRRNQNIDILITRFPGLRKYQARAALTMSDNELDKAIVLLEVCSCYRKKVKTKKLSTSYLRSIQINLSYDNEEQDPTLRNVVLESILSNKRPCVQDCELDSCGRSTTSEGERVGVIIVKTTEGYKADLL